MSNLIMASMAFHVVAAVVVLALSALGGVPSKR
jgi:hypothetical protein